MAGSERRIISILPIASIADDIPPSPISRHISEEIPRVLKVKGKSARNLFIILALFLFVVFDF